MANNESWEELLKRLREAEEKKKEQEAKSKSSQEGTTLSLDELNKRLGIGQQEKGGLLSGYLKKPESYKNGWSIPQTILGTLNDIGANVNTAVIDATEALIDTHAYGIGLFGGEQFKQKTADFISQDLLDHINQRYFGGEAGEVDSKKAGQFLQGWSPILTGDVLSGALLRGKVDEYSVLDEKADSLVQSGAHMVGSQALEKFAKVPSWLTMGVNAFGGELEEAFQNDATYKQAGVSAAITAVAEGITEKLGGAKFFGGKTVSDGVTKLLTKKMKRALGKYATKFLVDASSEGAEEVLSGLISAAGKRFTYMKEKDFREIFSSEDAFDAFFGGFLLGGIGSGVDVVQSAKAGVDPVSKLTQNEEAVVDAIYQKRLAEEEKPTSKKKGEIYDQVVDDMNRGRITTAEIEEVLGGDTYKEYQEASQKEKDVLKSLEEVYEGDELETQRQKILSESKLEEIKSRLTNEVSQKVGGDRLAESYREGERKKQKFEADVNAYPEAQRATVQAAIDSGVLNNTNRSHELVDLVAKLSAEKNTPFDFANNERLKQSGFAVEGAVVNGVVQNGRVTLNVDSSKALNTVVGHEITHVLEGTDLYKNLADAAIKFAKNKGEYATRMRQLRSLYQTIEEYKGADGQQKIEQELVADLVGDYLFSDTKFVQSLYSGDRNLFQKVFDEIKYLAKIATAGSKEARELERLKKVFEDVYKGTQIDPQRITENEGDVQYSLTYSKDIAKGQTEYAMTHKSHITEAELSEAQKVTQAMVDVMIKYSSILPEDKIGKVLTKNGSYDRSVENTTICVRTLAYNEFVDKVQEELGRPLSQMESFLVSQKLYDIATDPQCMYCYVSLDRKAFNDMLLRYMADRDTVIAKYNESDKSPAAVNALYEEFLNKRKPTKEMRARFDSWINYADSGERMLTLADISTEERQRAIKADGGALADQLADARKYAQSASWAKIQKNYVAYRDEILKLGDKVVKNLNEHYGLRWYSFSDYSAAFIVENMQQITDAAIRGLKGLSYTKDTDFAEVFAPSGMNINISVFVKRDANGNYYIDDRQSANIERAKELRNQYPNVGIVASVTDDDALRWAAEQEWSDVIIPFHIVRTGTDVAEFYKWLNYTDESADRVADKDLWDAYVDSLNIKSENARKKVGKNIYPSEHKNNKEIYLNLCQSRGLTPRFARFAGEDWYMKLVNETRLPADQSTALKPVFNEDAAKASFEKFVQKGGYEGGWYKEGVDVDAEAAAVADDVRAGLKANEVSYGRQDGFNPDELLANRKQNRTHGKLSLSSDDSTYTGRGIYGEDVRYEGTEETTQPENAVENSEYPEEWSAEDDDPEYLQQRADLIADIGDKNDFISRKAQQLYNELRSARKGIRFSPNLERVFDEVKAVVDIGDSWQPVKSALINISNSPENIVNLNTENENYKVEIAARTAMERIYDGLADQLSKLDKQHEIEKNRPRRAQVQQAKIQEVQNLLGRFGFDLDNLLDNPKRRMSTPETVDTTPQRVLEKTFGYKAGQALSDATVNKVAQDETAATKWLDSITNRKNGLLATLSKEHHIKSGSKEVAAAQMYAEGFYVDKNGNFIKYGNEELAADFPDKEVQRNIKALAKDKRIREFYDNTLEEMNRVLVRNGYRPVPRLDNYYLHFINNEDLLSKIGVPFNPTDAKAKDLPTELAGRTADLKPGRPFFSSGLHRKGKATSFDLFAGIERYANMAKNVIYQTDNIQTLRALQFYIYDRYGRSKGLENLDVLTPEEIAERIQKVYNGHLSTFASFLNTEANILAGKTSIIDRAISEGLIGRRFLTFADAINKQFGSATVGGNISSANTNWLPAVREIAKSNPADTVKAFSETIANVFSGGRFDGFREDSSVYARRKGADRFNRTLWQKAQEPGFWLMGQIDSVATEFIARTEYHKALRNGMSPEEAHYEADKKTSRLMGDRSLGQMPQIYTSRIMQMFLKFQMEVRNDIDSMFYDTIQEEKAANEGIKNSGERNARIAGNVAIKFASTALALHLFGKAFESIAGYNPAFDIIEALSKAVGWDDDEESEDTTLDNLGQGAMTLLEDLPYSSLFLDGGRIPMSSMLPVKELVKGEDEYGNDKPRWQTLAEIAPYYLLPTGGGQLKKTAKGLSMFIPSEDKPVTGSYTDSGDLRFPVEPTVGNIAQAAVFGQYASKNAREYFDEGFAPLSPKQVKEYQELDLPISDYWKIREGMKGLSTLNEKGDYIESLPLTTEQKNLLINNISDRKKKIDMTAAGQYPSFEEFDFAQNNRELYEFLNKIGVSYEEYKAFPEKTRDAYNWAANNQDAYEVSRVVTDNLTLYRTWAKQINSFTTDRDEKGKITKSAKDKVKEYIGSIPATGIQKMILFKQAYPADDTYNQEIVSYIMSLDLTYQEKVTVLRELGFTVRNGKVEP